jgi:cobalamin-dependent methionine synthase I
VVVVLEMILRFVSGLCAVMAIALVVQYFAMQSVVSDLEQRNRDIAAMRLERDQARLAEAVAEAAASRIQQKAEEYDALREALLSGDEDVPIPDWFRDWLVDLGVVGVRPDD